MKALSEFPGRMFICLKDIYIDHKRKIEKERKMIKKNGCNC